MDLNERSLMDLLGLDQIKLFDPAIDHYTDQIEVPTVGWDWEDLRLRAVERSARLKETDHSYDDADPDRCETGLIGEMAAMQWLSEVHPVVGDVADDPDWYRRGDIAFKSRDPFETTGELGLEVKCARYPGWLNFGRSLKARQLERSRAAAYVWCVAADEPKPELVEIVGWLPRSRMRSEVNTMLKDGVRVVTPMLASRELPAWMASQ